MLFPDKLAEAQKLIQPEINVLFDLALKNQSHPNDLLLVLINGFFDPMALELNKHIERKVNPHSIGFGKEGLSEQSHYKFIDKYRKELVTGIPHKEYLEKVKYDPDKQKEIDELTNFEEYTIQLEMLIYLKIWEADMIIRRFYETVNLIYGEPFDWYFRFCKSYADKNCERSRSNIINNVILNRLEKYTPSLVNTLKTAYVPQIRNSIAHSNYSFLGRSIHPNNDVKNDPESTIVALSFDEWGNMFHKTIMVHSEYIGLKKKIHDHYKVLTIKNGNKIPIRIIEKSGKKYESEISYYAIRNNWIWTASLNESEILEQIEIDKHLSESSNQQEE